MSSGEDAGAVSKASRSSDETASSQRERHPYTPEQKERWRQEHQVAVFGDINPEPVFELLDLVAPEAVHRAFQDEGFQRPTPIQSLSWPILLQSRDMIGVAKTGNGKTLAFIVPAVLHVIAAQPSPRRGDGPIALVLAPTRELAIAIEAESRTVASRCRMRIVCVYGGAPRREQELALGAVTHICVATPTRLLDLAQSPSTNLRRVTYLVIDEVDRMLDMGFNAELRAICSQIRPDRQTVMYSALWSDAVRELAVSFTRDLVRVHVVSAEGEDGGSISADVRQHIMIMSDEDEKLQRLNEIMRVVPDRCPWAFVFVKSSLECDKVQRNLLQAGFNASAIRDANHAVLEQRNTHTGAVFVVTGAAARGLRVKKLECVVVNFDFPNTIEEYVRRIGLVGRTGDAYSFLIRERPQLIRALRDVLTQSKQPVPDDLHAAEEEGIPSVPLRFTDGRCDADSSLSVVKEPSGAAATTDPPPDRPAVEPTPSTTSIAEGHVTRLSKDVSSDRGDSEPVEPRL